MKRTARHAMIVTAVALSFGLSACGGGGGGGGRKTETVTVQSVSAGASNPVNNEVVNLTVVDLTTATATLR